MQKWIEKYIKVLSEIIEKPPYLVFVFVSAVTLIVSISVNRYFNQIFSVFLYSLLGSVWRYVEKDLESGINKMIYNNNEREDKRHPLAYFIIILIYHIGNIALLWGLILYLRSLIT